MTLDQQEGDRPLIGPRPRKGEPWMTLVRNLKLALAIGLLGGLYARHQSSQEVAMALTFYAVPAGAPAVAR